MSGQLVDSLSHISTVKLFAHAGREQEAAEGSVARYRETAQAFGRMTWIFRTWLAFLSGVLPVALMACALWLWQQGQASPGVIALAGLISTRIAQMSGWISFTAMGIFANVGVIEDGIRTLTPEHKITDAPDAVAPGTLKGRVEFADVSFRYGRGVGGIGGFSLDIQPGERVALVGHSGAGKSTVVSLLSRLYDVEGGAIRVDGQDIRDLTQDGLRGQISVVTQEAAMFNRSALDNIRYGKPNADEAEAHRAAAEAAADGFIADLRDYKGRAGYAAHLGERGVKLSGGQRQRIALARAILKDAPILVLDEATAALDSESEAAIQQALQRLMPGKTVIAIAHRLSTICPYGPDRCDGRRTDRRAGKPCGTAGGRWPLCRVLGTPDRRHDRGGGGVASGCTSFGRGVSLLSVCPFKLEKCGRPRVFGCPRQMSATLDAP